MKEICQNKYEHATSEQEYQFIQQQINGHKNSFNQIFQNSSFTQTISTLIAAHPSIDHMQQSQLLQQFQTIVDQARNDIFQLYTKILEDERKISRKKYEESLKKLWSIQYYHSKDHNQTVSPTMIQIIIERCTKVGERIDCIYKFKTQQSNFS